uniref:Uncharacterized protein n=1 Tax=Siphoviridae sp. ct3R83 TaxID=2827559 RepID=A0A8S5LPQ4_9CAUD|nr:MAG TPA: hypothetical protein [Siphoviridae sp. ct3R83]DAN88528.1 MAG TPA: hypothetical protein [Caudoviricetes sp.]DAY24592.1 MAG TPA: hypothetical protein [Caudoviricetes sp.]
MLRNRSVFVRKYPLQFLTGVYNVREQERCPLLYEKFPF